MLCALRDEKKGMLQTKRQPVRLASDGISLPQGRPFDYAERIASCECLFQSHKVMPLDDVMVRRTGAEAKPILKGLDIPNRHYYQENGVTLFRYGHRSFLSADPDLAKYVAWMMLEKLEKPVKSNDPENPNNPAEIKKLSFFNHLDRALCLSESCKGKEPAFEDPTERSYFMLIRAQSKVNEAVHEIRACGTKPDTFLYDGIDGAWIAKLVADRQLVQISGKEYVTVADPNTSRTVPAGCPPKSYYDTGAFLYLTDNKGDLFYLYDSDRPGRIPSSPAFKRDDELSTAGPELAKVTFCDTATKATYNKIRAQQLCDLFRKNVCAAKGDVPRYPF